MRDEPRVGAPLGMVRAPQREALGIRARQPVERARQVRLHRRPARCAAGATSSASAVLIPATDQGLAPRGEQHAERSVAGRAATHATKRATPRDRDRARAIVLALGERAVVAAVVAAGERAAVEDGQVHASAYPAIARPHGGGEEPGPSASARARPSRVSRIDAPGPVASPRSSNSRSSGKSSAAERQTARRSGRVRALGREQRLDQAPALFVGVEHERRSRPRAKSSSLVHQRR